MDNWKIIGIIGLPFFLAAAFGIFIFAEEKKRPAVSKPIDTIDIETAPPVSPSPPAADTSPSTPPRPTEGAVDPTPASQLLVPQAVIAPEVSSSEGGSNKALYETLTLLIQKNKEEEAIAVLHEIIKNDPGDANAQIFLGELYYKADQLPQAISVWEKILENDPSNKRARHDLEKAQREQTAQGTFRREATRHFTIKFEGAENRDLYKTVLENLEEAYGSVGRALSFYPTEEVIVFLYTDQQFFDVTRAPSWSGGRFDGKIRMPAKGYENRLPRLRETLFHEYVHAVVHQIVAQKAMGNLSRVSEKGGVRPPQWLNEGVAMYLEPGETKNDFNRWFKNELKQGAFIDLPYLHGSFSRFTNKVLVDMAYSESFSAVQFMVDQFGIYRLKKLLENLGHANSFEEAFSDALLISYEEFQKRWKESLKS